MLVDVVDIADVKRDPIVVFGLAEQKLVIDATSKDITLPRFDLDPKAFSVITYLYKIAFAQPAQDRLRTILKCVWIFPRHFLRINQGNGLRFHSNTSPARNR